MKFSCELHIKSKIEDEDILEPACDLDRVIAEMEFRMNITEQVPHWHLLSLAGLRYFKANFGNRVTKKMIKRWKEEQEI